MGICEIHETKQPGCLACNFDLDAERRKARDAHAASMNRNADARKEVRARIIALIRSNTGLVLEAAAIALEAELSSGQSYAHAAVGEHLKDLWCRECACFHRPVCEKSNDATD